MINFKLDSKFSIQIVALKKKMLKKLPQFHFFTLSIVFAQV